MDKIAEIERLQALQAELEEKIEACRPCKFRSELIAEYNETVMAIEFLETAEEIEK